MPRQLYLTLELPDEVVKQLPYQELAAKAKEALVMALLRETASRRARLLRSLR